MNAPERAAPPWRLPAVVLAAGLATAGVAAVRGTFRMVRRAPVH